MKMNMRADGINRGLKFSTETIRHPAVQLLTFSILFAAVA
jgi:hypothetical protein